MPPPATLEVWNGSVNGKFNDANNWTTSVPVDGVGWVVPKDVTQAIDDDLDQTSKNFALILVEKGATALVASTGSPLRCTWDKFIHRGQGKVVLTSENDVGGAGLNTKNSDNTIIAGNVDNNTEISVIATANSTTIARILCLSGLTKIDANSGTIPLIQLGFVSNPSTDAKCVLSTGGDTAITRLVMNGGEVTSESVITTLVSRGGIITQGGVAAIPTVYMVGGTMIYNSTGVITTLEGLSGVATFTDTELLKTITDLYDYSGTQRSPGDFILNESQTTLTVTTRHDMDGFGE